jgi:uridine kinase
MTPERAEVLARIAAELVKVPVAHPLRVAIDGVTASGKTTVADELAVAVRAEGRPCIRVSMDGFHNPRAVRHRQGRESAVGYYEDAYDFDALRRELLDPLGPTGSLRYRTAVLDLARDEPVVPAPQTAATDLIVIVDGSFLQRRDLNNAWDVVVYLRASFAVAGARGAARDAELLGSHEEAVRLFDVRYHAAARTYLEEFRPDDSADIVVDNEDPARPFLVREVAELTRVQPRLRRTRAFFADRAQRWDERFPDDDAAYAAAIGEFELARGAVAVDLGCGTGRALPHLRDALGPEGLVVGIDVTPEMLHVSSAKRGSMGSLALADVSFLPLAAGTVDAIFAAGLLTHVPDPHALLRELARAARPKCRLMLFHPVGRAALARQHRRTLQPDELLDPSALPRVLAAAGWDTERIDDADERYLAVARLPR